MNKKIIKAKGKFIILNYVISIISIIFINIFYISFISIITKKELLIAIILSILIIYENIILILKIKYANSCKIIFEKDKLTLTTLKPKIKSKTDLIIYLISLKNSKQKRILVPKTETIYYKDIIKYGYLKDLKIKIPYSEKKSFAIITKENKYHLREDKFSKIQINDIKNILDKNIL